MQHNRTISLYVHNHYLNTMFDECTFEWNIFTRRTHYLLYQKDNKESRAIERDISNPTYKKNTSVGDTSNGFYVILCDPVSFHTIQGCTQGLCQNLQRHDFATRTQQTVLLILLTLSRNQSIKIPIKVLFNFTRIRLRST